MKNLLLLFLLFFFSSQLLSQKTIAEGKTWNLMVDNIFTPETTTEKRKLEGDTLINGKTYLKQWTSRVKTGEDWRLSEYFLREDSNGKIFSYRFGIENLVFDFGAALGETIVVGGNDCEIVIHKIDSVQLLDGSMRKVMHGYNPKPPNFAVDTTRWIEGIGGMGSHERSHQLTCSVDAIFVFLCYYENGQILYQRPPFDECFIWTSTEEKFNSENIKIAPNPTRGNLSINIDEGIKAGRFEILDLHGKILKTDQIESRVFEVDVSHFPKGIYLIKVIGKGEISYSQKIIKSD